MLNRCQNWSLADLSGRPSTSLSLDCDSRRKLNAHTAFPNEGRLNTTNEGRLPRRILEMILISARQTTVRALMKSLKWFILRFSFIRSDKSLEFIIESVISHTSRKSGDSFYLLEIHCSNAFIPLHSYCKIHTSQLSHSFPIEVRHPRV